MGENKLWSKKEDEYVSGRGGISQFFAHSVLTLDGPTPTNISKNSDPLTVMKGTLASPAVALASNVFPVPGGPDNIAP